jgi:hypothetical protein
MTRKKDSSFSEEKEAKRLLFSGGFARARCVTMRRETKVFCFFFSKKKKNLT